MAEEEEGSWDQTVEEWVISEGYCVAGALAQCADGAFYAAAPVAGEAGWAHVFKEDHEEDILQDDDTTKKVTICEATSLLETITNGKAPPTGLWLGGLKYTVTRYEPEFESGDYTLVVISAARPKKGVHLVSTGSQILACFYDEEKSQSPGNAKKAALAFAEYLKGIGY
uniref:Profilin n=1 Tax=Alexandrium andersonii TaxID=327968 RepID=A0A7S2ANW7_9DINO|mmetsp:Transcript_15872/g.35798  ORF Transcript_15872/g.35798 Transcript_15872/m.35798 type:complete len:169 (+) Transcript_15872:86-592(+)